MKTMKVKLLKTYLTFDPGTVLCFDNKLANRLVEEGIARKLTNRDYLVQAQTSFKAITRALKNPFK